MQELQFEITEESYEHAKKANDSECLVAEAIKAKYPHFSRVKVNLTSIRITDPKSGERLFYFTPPSIAQILISFDQGWKESKFPKLLRLRQRDLGKITPITASASTVKLHAEYRAKRLAELEEKEKGGEALSHYEKMALTRMRKPRKTVERPTYEGKPVFEGKEPHIIVRGGKEKILTDARLDPNLLGGKTRHFGAKLAEPGETFSKAVEAAVEAALQSKRARRTDE